MSQRFPYRLYAVGMQVVFPKDYWAAISNDQQLVPAGTTAHVVYSDAQLVSVVPHLYLPLISSWDASGDWRHEIQWLADEYEDHPDMIPFVPADHRTRQLRKRRSFEK